MKQKDEEQLSAIFYKFSKLKSRIQFEEMTHGEYIILGTVLSFMHEHEENNATILGAQISELTVRLHSTKPALSKSLSRLETKEYIKRIKDKKDKRVAYIELTNKGKTLLKESKENMNKFWANILSNMGEKDRQELFRILEKLYGIMEKEIR
jgi:DNA-binding MarR family transcriptional regulator